MAATPFSISCLRRLLRVPHPWVFILLFVLLIPRISTLQTLIVVLRHSQVRLESALSTYASTVNFLLSLPSPHCILIEISKFIGAIAVPEAGSRVLFTINLNLKLFLPSNYICPLKARRHSHIHSDAVNSIAISRGSSLCTSLFEVWSGIQLFLWKASLNVSALFFPAHVAQI